MKIELTPQQEEYRNEFKIFVGEEIVPHAAGYDEDERTPSELIRKLGRRGYLGAALPKENNGLGLDMVTFGLLNEELGRGCSSVRSLLTVHSMVAHAIQKSGNRQQKDYWLPQLASGELIAAFALTEPEVGCDANKLQTSATLLADCYVLRDNKEPSSPVVPITVGGSKRPFFVAHGVGGNVATYLELAKQLGPDQVFYGLQTPIPEYGAQFNSLEEMVACYLEEIRKIQPEVSGRWLVDGRRRRLRNGKSIAQDGPDSGTVSRYGCQAAGGEVEGKHKGL